MNEILDTAKYPFLMNKKTMMYSPSSPEAYKQFKDEVVPITHDQALDLDARGKAAGVEILRAIVAADNVAALKAAEAQLDAMAPAPAPGAPAEPAEPALKDMPLADLRAKAVKANEGETLPDGSDINKMSRKELVAFLKNYEGE